MLLMSYAETFLARLQKSFFLAKKVHILCYRFSSRMTFLLQIKDLGIINSECQKEYISLLKSILLTLNVA